LGLFISRKPGHGYWRGTPSGSFRPLGVGSISYTYSDDSPVCVALITWFARSGRLGEDPLLSVFLSFLLAALLHPLGCIRLSFIVLPDWSGIGKAVLLGLLAWNDYGWERLDFAQDASGLHFRFFTWSFGMGFGSVFICDRSCSALGLAHGTAPDGSSRIASGGIRIWLNGLTFGA